MFTESQTVMSMPYCPAVNTLTIYNDAIDPPDLAL